MEKGTKLRSRNAGAGVVAGTYAVLFAMLQADLVSGRRTISEVRVILDAALPALEGFDEDTHAAAAEFVAALSAELEKFAALMPDPPRRRRR